MSQHMTGPYARFRLNRPCPKCGSGPTPSVICSMTRPSGWGIFGGDHVYVPEGDHLHRTCSHCAHARIELAMDTPLMADTRRAIRLMQLEAEWRDARTKWSEMRYR
jgi:hypothetical protein